MRNDLIYALRGFRKKPLFTFCAVLTLALGIGRTGDLCRGQRRIAAAASLPAPDRLMMLWTYNPRQGFDKDVSAYPNFDDWRRRSASFDGMSAYTGANFTLTQAGDPAQIRGAVVTPGFFETLENAPALGRAFGPREGMAGGGSGRDSQLRLVARASGPIPTSSDVRSC